MYGPCNTHAINQLFMLKGQRFERLADQFKTLALDLSVCEDAGQRKELLGKMKAIVDSMDELNLGQHDGSTKQSVKTR